jgi:WD40 repeat protein
LIEQPLRLFVSSPNDVKDERRRVDLVVDRLNAEFKGRVRIASVRWETSYYSAHETFQKQIPEAADCDIVVAIFRARLGTALPDDFPRLPNGQRYPSGTAYEVLSAILARKNGKPLPDIYVFRYPNPPSVTLDSADRAEIEAQWEQLKGFFDAWFKTHDGQFVAAFQNYATTDDFAAKVEDCLRQWLARHGFLLQGPVWDRVLRGSPFPGLSAFEADRGTIFFGRELAITRSIERLREAGADDKHLPFLLVIGASGSGKSSLLRAGLLPRLTQPGTIPEIDLWREAVVTPGPDPFASLAECVLSRGALGPELSHGAFKEPRVLATLLASDPASAVALLRESLKEAAEQRQRAAKFERPRPARLALVIDQAERLFIEAQPQKVKAFSEFLVAVAREKLAFIIMALRSDAYARFQGVGALLALRAAGATFDLTPPSSAEIEEMVRRPVECCLPPLAFERNDTGSLASVLVADAKGGDALPLLQVTLSRLYAAEEKRRDGMLRFVDYSGMSAAVSAAANDALGTLDAAARAELPSLVAGLVGDVATDPVTGALTPAVAALDRRAFEAQKPARKSLVDAFVEKRLLAAEGDGLSERVRPVHESLLRIWPAAADIVTEIAALIRVRRTLEPIVRDWSAASAADKPDYVELSAPLLAGAQQAATRFGDDLPEDMRDFIARATAVDAERRERERQEQERRVHDAETLAAANRRIARRTGVGLAAALVLAGLAGWQWRSAEAQRNQALLQESLALSTLSEATGAAGDNTTAMLIALEALPSPAFGGARPFSAKAAMALYQAWLRNRETALVAGSEVPAVALSPDGRSALTASGRSVKLWDLSREHPIGHQLSVQGPIAALSYGATGPQVITLSADNALQFWTMSGDRLSSRTLAPAASNNSRVEFSSDGRRAVVISAENDTQVWDLSNELAAQSLGAASRNLFSAAVSRDGSRVATMSKDGTTGMWDMSRHPPVFQQLERVPGNLSTVAISVDGARIAAPRRDGTVTVWDLSDLPPKPTVLKGHSDFVRSVAFSSDGRHLVTGSLDHTARMWDLAEQPPKSVVLTQHADFVVAVAFSADGTRVITGSADGTAHVLDLSDDRPTSRILRGTAPVLYAAFGPGPGSALTIGTDGSVLAWDLTGAEPSSRKLESLPEMVSVGFSPDHGWMVVVPRDGSAALWDLSVQRPPRRFVVPMGQAAVAVSTDGQQVVTHSIVGSAAGGLWDLTREPPTVRPLRVAPNNTIETAIFAPGGRHQHLLTGVRANCVDCVPLLWNLSNDPPTAHVLKSANDRGYLMSAAMSGDGHRAAIVWGAGIVDAWDISAENPMLIVTLPTNMSNVLDAAFGPDPAGTRLLTVSHDQLARIWNISHDPPQPTVLAGHRGDVVFGAFSPDGKQVVTTSKDNTARVWWDLSSERPVSAVLEGHSGEVLSAVFSPDRKLLLTLSADGTARLWPALPDVQDLIRKVESELGRCLSLGQREHLGLKVEARSPGKDQVVPPDNNGRCPR